MPSPKPWPMGNEFHNLCRGFHEHHYHVFRFGVIGKFSKAYYKLTTWPYWSHPWAWTPDAGGHELHNFDRGLLGHHKHVFSFSHTCGLRERDFLKCCLFCILAMPMRSQAIIYSVLKILTNDKKKNKILNFGGIEPTA